MTDTVKEPELFAPATTQDDPQKLEFVRGAVANPTPMDLLQIALTHKAGMDVIRGLKELQNEERAHLAEVEFNKAMNAVQAELGRIAPDLTNPQTHSKYASYAALDKKLRPIYTKHGFSLSFNSGESSPETVRAYCYVSHRDGHTRTYQSPDMPADGKGAKGGDVMTRTHATGAAMSYAMRYLLKYIFNIAIGEDDSDGNLGTNGELAERIEWIQNATTKEELAKLYKQAYQDFEESPAAIKAIVAARKTKQKEFE